METLKDMTLLHNYFINNLFVTSTSLTFRRKRYFFFSELTGPPPSLKCNRLTFSIPINNKIPTHIQCGMKY